MTRHFINKTAAFLFLDLTFFNGVMGCISLCQAIRMWMPDVLFDVPGYAPLQHLMNENLFAMIPFIHGIGCFFRYYGSDFFQGKTWFWRVGQVTHIAGAIAFATPAISISYSLHSIGLQTIAQLVISAAMLLQLARTDA